MRIWLGFFWKIVRFLLALFTLKIHGMRKHWIMFQPSIPLSTLLQGALPPETPREKKGF